MESQHCKQRSRILARRFGTSLVETMAVVAVTAVLLGLAVCLFRSLQLWDTRYRFHGQQSDQMANLAEAIRGDIRSATEVTLPTDSKLNIDRAGEVQVRYELLPEGCKRVAKDQDGKERIEIFTIGPPGNWKLERESTGRRPAIRLSLDRSKPDAKDEAALAQMLVYEVVGADAVPGGSVDTPKAESTTETAK